MWMCAVLKRENKKKFMPTHIQVANLKRRDIIEITDREINKKYSSYSIE